MSESPEACNVTVSAPSKVVQKVVVREPDVLEDHGLVSV